VAANDRARAEAAKRVEAEREQAEVQRERAEAQRERAEANDRATRLEAEMLELQQKLRVGIVHSDE